jgi:hypothetical protein
LAAGGSRQLPTYYFSRDCQPSCTHVTGEIACDDRRVIRRPKVLVRVAEIVTPTTTIHAVPEDDVDDRILECAVAGRADVIGAVQHPGGHVRQIRQSGG